MPNRGELTAGLAGAVLLVSLFLPWFGPDPAASGWEGMSVIDVILGLVGVVGVALPILRATQRKTDLPIVTSVFLALGGLLATLLVLYRLADPLGDGREVGLYLGVAGALGVATGAWLGMRNEET